MDPYGDNDMNYSNRELALIANTDVLGHIRMRNEEMATQAKAEGWLFWMGPCESLADEYANVYEYMHCGACSDFSDGYKELNGIRPRWVKTSLMTLEQVEGLVEELNEESRAMAEWELACEELAQAEMEGAQDEADWRNRFESEFLLQDELSGFRRRT